MLDREADAWLTSQRAEARDIRTVFRMMALERERPSFWGRTVSGWSIITVTYLKSIMQELTSVCTHTSGAWLWRFGVILWISSNVEGTEPPNGNTDACKEAFEREACLNIYTCKADRLAPLSLPKIDICKLQKLYNTEILWLVMILFSKCPQLEKRQHFLDD